MQCLLNKKILRSYIIVYSILVYVFFIICSYHIALLILFGYLVIWLLHIEMECKWNAYMKGEPYSSISLT